MSLSSTQEYDNHGDTSNSFLWRVVDLVKNAIYEIEGRPKGDGELGGQAAVSCWVGESAVQCRET